MVYTLVKKKIFPNVHVQEQHFHLNGNAGGAKKATIVPIIMQDEGKGDPNSKYTNPESASFAETNEPNCYPDSRVNYARTNIEMSLTKGARVTDNQKVMKVMVVPITMSFLEDYTAKDEVSTNEIEDVLEMQHETSDRQGYPLFNGTKLNGTATDLGTNVPGLTTNTNIEGVAFNPNLLYDALQFYTTGGKMRSVIGKIRHLNVSDNRILRLGFRIKSKAKRMNPYTFFGILIYLVPEDSKLFLGTNGDLTDIDHLTVRCFTRYNEWNENFNFMR